MKYSVKVKFDTEIEINAASQEQAVQQVKDKLKATLEELGPYSSINHYGWVRARRVTEE